MENNTVLKNEGRVFNVNKEILDDQKVLEVGTEISNKAKIGKSDKQNFEEYKILFKGAIDEKCMAEYGSCEDKKLWEDTAKEMFLKSSTYVPQEDMKADGDLDKKEESKNIKKENKVLKTEKSSITVTRDVDNEEEALDIVNDTSYFDIGEEVEVRDWNDRHYTVKKTKDIKYKDGERIEEGVSKKSFKVKVNTPFGEMALDMEAETQEEANEKVVAGVKDALADQYKDQVSLVEAKLVEAEINNVADTFKNYNAFANNFEPVVIAENDGQYYIYKEDKASTHNTPDPEYIQVGNKDYIEGWLYGCVQANMKVVTPKLSESKECPKQSIEDKECPKQD